MRRKSSARKEEMTEAPLSALQIYQENIETERGGERGDRQLRQTAET